MQLIKISDIAGGSTGENPGGDEEEEPEEPIDEPGIDFGKLTEEENRWNDRSICRLYTSKWNI